MKNKKFDICKILFLLSLFITPLLCSFFVVILNNYEKYSSLFKTSIVLSICICLIVLVITFIQLVKDNMIFTKKNMFAKVAVFVFFSVFVFENVSAVHFIYYDENFKEWLISSSSSSIRYQDLAGQIYSKYTLDDYSNDEEEMETDIIDFDVDYNLNLYANKYEQEIMEHEEGQIYKIIKLTGKTSGTGSNYVGYLAVVYDPSHVKLAKSSGAGVDDNAYGETLATIARKNNALVAINAGGFYDPFWNSNGGIPHGDVFIDGKLDTTFRRGDFGGGIVGFNKENKLILKYMSTEEAINAGIRDAVDWGPFLIVNGVNQYKNNQTYWECGRTAIGQRADGVVLLLVVDGLQSHSQGASYKDLADILERYGAVNAASMDGGTSTSMVENGKYVNSPWNGYYPTFRWLPNAWVVVP